MIAGTACAILMKGYWRYSTRKLGEKPTVQRRIAAGVARITADQTVDTMIHTVLGIVSDAREGKKVTEVGLNALKTEGEDLGLNIGSELVLDAAGIAVKKVVGAVRGGSTTLNDWVNRIPDLSKQAPIEIPSNAAVKVQAKNGYDQISFKWTENGQNYEVRWHTKTPGAPEGQGNTWVVSRVIPGTPTGQIRTEYILVEDAWIPRYQWQDAINAYRNGTATQEQLQLLKDGHWQAP